MIVIPEDLLPADGRFGSGPAKVRPEALEYLSLRGDVLGTSHRQAPVKQLVATVQEGLRELYRLPEGYQVVLGNGGSTVFWDVAVCSLIERRSAHAVFGEFTRKFARAAAAAPFLADPAITQCDPGAVVLPAQEDADVVAWAQNETSTGAAAPVERIGDGLVLIDATSAAGGMAADISRTDVYYFAPQKNFSSDGGLWVAFCSPAALERAERIATSGRWIPESLNLGVAASNSARNQTLNTPAIATLLLLEDQIGWLLDLGGIDAARGLALLGMMAAHVGFTTCGLTSLSGVLDQAHGRSAVLFAVIAGFSLGIMSGRARPHTGEALIRTRLRILVRSALLLAMGTGLALLGPPVGVILGYYAA